jgi:putative ABC transport system substrate-binding protein
MKRREFISLLCGAAATWPIATRAQGKAVRLVYLAELSPEATPRLWNLFREELRSRGWTEGANLSITPRWGAQLSDALAHELVTLKPDAIVAWATPAVAAAQRATKSIPIVMVGVADPVAVGFIDDLARPGGNITGTTNLARDLGGKLLELLDELVPSLASVTVLKNPRNPASTFQFREIAAASQHLNRQVVSIDVSTGAELDNAFIRMKRENAKAAVALADPFFFSSRGALPISHGTRDCLSYFRGVKTSRPVDFCLTVPVWPISFALLPTMSTRFSEVQNRRNCRSNSQLNSSWSSTSKPPRRSGSKFRRGCSLVPTR